MKKLKIDNLLTITRLNILKYAEAFGELVGVNDLNRYFKDTIEGVCYNYYQAESTETKHKVFVSYYHTDDQAYRNIFEQKLGHLFISNSVNPGDIDSGSIYHCVKRLITRRLYQ